MRNHLVYPDTPLNSDSPREIPIDQTLPHKNESVVEYYIHPWIEKVQLKSLEEIGTLFTSS